MNKFTGYAYNKKLKVGVGPAYGTFCTSFRDTDLSIDEILADKDTVFCTCDEFMSVAKEIGFVPETEYKELDSLLETK